jgi:hypothetical protein
VSISVAWTTKLTADRYSGEQSAGGHGYTARRPATDELAPTNETASQGAHWRPVYDNVEEGGHFSPARYTLDSDHSDSDDACEKPRKKKRKSDRPISARKKAERVRMLEKAFGPTPRTTQTPRLAPVGRKKRVATRLAQVLLAFLAVLGSLGGLLVCSTSPRVQVYEPHAAQLSHPKERPPVGGKIPTAILYALSVISLLATLYLYVFRPCCTKRPRTSDDAQGRYVIPLSSGVFDEEAGCCCGGARRKQRRQAGRAPVINLLIDPAALSRHLASRHDDVDGDGDTEAASRPRRSSIAKEPPPDADPADDDSDSASFVVSKLEEPARYEGARGKTFRRARRPFSSPGLLAFDALLALLWLLEVGYAVGFSPRCLAGTHEGFCEGYNGALAAGCFLAVSCGVAVVLGVRDRRRQRARPHLHVTLCMHSARSLAVTERWPTHEAKRSERSGSLHALVRLALARRTEAPGAPRRLGQALYEVHGRPPARRYTATHLHLLHLGGRDPLEDELGDAVADGDCACKSSAPEIRKMRRRARTLVVLLAVVEEEDVERPPVVGVDDAGARLDRMLRRCAAPSRFSARPSGTRGRSAPSPLRGATRP